MASYDVTDQTANRRVQFTGDGTAGPFAFTFQVNATSEVKVYVDSTEKTETSHYTVSLNSGTGAGTISFTTGNEPTSSETITILSDVPLSRTSVYTSGGQLTASSLESDFDTNMFIHQQTNEEINRSLRLAEHDVISGADMTLPVKATRLGKILGFNSTTGNPEATFTVADGNTLSDISADIATLADIEDGTDATDAIQTVAGISSNVSTVSGISSNVSTVAGISSNVTTVAGNNANVTTVASNIDSVNTVATNITDVVAVANDLAEAVSEVETVANDLNEATSEIETVANAITNVDAVGTNIANVNTVAGISSDVTTVAGVSANVTTVAGVSSDVTTVAGISSNVTTVAGDTTDIGTVATNISNVNTVAGIDNDVTTVAGISSDVTTVAGISSNVSTIATNVTSINNFDARYRVASSDPTTSLDAGDLYFNTSDNELKAYNGTSWQTTALSSALQNNISIVAGEITAQEDLGSIADAIDTSSGNNIDTVANNITNINTVAGDTTAINAVASDASDIGAVATNIANVNTVAGNNTNINTVAGISSDVTSVAGISSNVTTVANNLSSINNFEARYRVASSEPSTSLDEGDLYYNTTTNSLNYYNGSSFVAVVAGAMTSLLSDTTPQLGGNLDVNGNSIVSVSNGDITIAPNGSGEINLNGTVNTDNLTIDFGSIA